MLVVEQLEAIPQSDYTVVAIGMFDGIHLGHRRIIENAVAISRREGGQFVLASFFPHPQKVIASLNAPRLLQTFDQQAEILDSLGTDYLYRIPFTRRLSMLSPLEFVEETLLPVGVRAVHVGRNFRFGHQRSGDFETLTRLGKAFGFTVTATPVQALRGERISSTRIRGLLNDGNVRLAAKLLGRPYEIRGSVVRGDRRGAELGFPTANVQTENELIPATGVYITRAVVNQIEATAATNIGFRPTVHGFRDPSPTVEAHLLDFSGDLYGQPIQLQFLSRIREEERFPSLEALIQQVQQDILWTREYARRLESRRKSPRESSS